MTLLGEACIRFPYLVAVNGGRRFSHPRPLSEGKACAFASGFEPVMVIAPATAHQVIDDVAEDIFTDNTVD